MSKNKITAQHCQQLGYCMKSVKPWFASHGLDFRDFVRNGIEPEKLLATNDEYARKIVAHAQEESGNGR